MTLSRRRAAISARYGGAEQPASAQGGPRGGPSLSVSPSLKPVAPDRDAYQALRTSRRYPRVEPHLLQQLPRADACRHVMRLALYFANDPALVDQLRYWELEVAPPRVRAALRTVAGVRALTFELRNESKGSSSLATALEICKALLCVPFGHDNAPLVAVLPMLLTGREKGWSTSTASQVRIDPQMTELLPELLVLMITMLKDAPILHMDSGLHVLHLQAPLPAHIAENCSRMLMEVWDVANSATLAGRAAKDTLKLLESLVLAWKEVPPRVLARPEFAALGVLHAVRALVHRVIELEPMLINSPMYESTRLALGAIVKAVEVEAGEYARLTVKPLNTKLPSAPLRKNFDLGPFSPSSIYKRRHRIPADMPTSRGGSPELAEQSGDGSGMPEGGVRAEGEVAQIAVSRSASRDVDHTLMLVNSNGCTGIAGWIPTGQGMITPWDGTMILEKGGLGTVATATPRRKLTAAEATAASDGEVGASGLLGRHLDRTMFRPAPTLEMEQAAKTIQKHVLRYLKKKKLHRHKAEERAMKDAQAAKDSERAVKAQFEAKVRGGQAMLENLRYLQRLAAGEDAR